ncbi:Ribosomal silencing factor RsfA [hydrothermal vent metagenome]|uniref:Ribosomal silencing factor RsfA n=1 Tax=hydrothermal vent metagenome TaxID=652676 RepID=A0A3B0ST58_9ZZZZ
MLWISVLLWDRTSILERVNNISAHRDSIEAAQVAAAAVLNKKGLDVAMLDMSELMPVTDMFLVATGTSSRHVKTLAGEIELQLKDRLDYRPVRREGLDAARWVLLDYGDIVIHIFDEETRAYYNLERLWADAPIIEVEPVTQEA